MTSASHRPPGSWVQEELRALHEVHQWRELRCFDAHGPTGRFGGSSVISFASNDYLGLATHPSLVDAARSALDRWGTSATASRLVVGTRPIHEELEAALAAWKQTDRAVTFPTGYAANLGVLTTLGGRDALIVSDELNHASIIDGCRLSRSRVAISRHNDVDHVESLLRERHEERALVVTDAVFSMDGDEAPVEDLARCCAEHGAVLVVDEAHAVLGPRMGALAGLPELELVRVVTLSKALGALGGAVCASSGVIDLLVNRARTFIFTTGLSPADAAAALAAVSVVRSQEGAALVGRLRELTRIVAPGHPSPIVPLIVGPEHEALEASRALLRQGLLVPAIRPPTVAPGTARLRVALSAAHTDAMVGQLTAGLEATGLRG